MITGWILDVAAEMKMNTWEFNFIFFEDGDGVFGFLEFDVKAETAGMDIGIKSKTNFWFYG